MLIFATDHFVLPLPAGHRFPMRKYARLRERVSAVAPFRMRVPPAATDDELASAHDRRYIAAVTTGTIDARDMRRIGFPWSTAMVERSRRSAGATLAACRSALACGAGVNLAGGTHHAHRDFGEGFCVFNDTAVAARTLLSQGVVQRVLVVDLDVHQGDAGADPYEGDRLGRLALTKRGLAQRDAYVLDTLRDAGIPVAITMAGGYADDVDDVVDIHFATVCAALERFGEFPMLDSPEPAAPSRCGVFAT